MSAAPRLPSKSRERVLAACRAAADGDLATIERLHARFVGRPEVCAAAARRGHLGIVRRLRERGCEWDETSCEGAAYRGHLDLLEYLRAHGCPWGPDTFAAAARGGHFGVVQYLHERGCPWDARCCARAANAGNFDLMKHLHDLGCPWDAASCAAAARSGRLDILEYLHERGCPWDAASCAAAAWIGRLDVLKYLHGRGCPCDVRASHRAAAKGHVDVLEYVQEIDPADWVFYPIHASVSTTAIRHGQLAAFKLVSDDQEGSDDFIVAAVHGQLEIVKYIHETHFTDVPEAVDDDDGLWLNLYNNAVATGRPAVVEYLHGLTPRWGPSTWDRGDARSRAAVRRAVYWPQMRAAVRARPYAVHWQEYVARARCAPGGVDRERDRAAFAAEFA